MEITRQFLGKELLKQLELGKHSSEIAAWMFQFTNELQIEPEAAAVLDRLAIMDAGPEFECSEQELRVLVEMLLNDEENIHERFMDMVISGDVRAANRNRIIEEISKPQLGEELLRLIETGKKINEIAVWAEAAFKKPGMGHEKRDILGRLAIMNTRPEAICTEKELRALARMLINNEAHITEKLLALIRERIPPVYKKKKK